MSLLAVLAGACGVGNEASTETGLGTSTQALTAMQDRVLGFESVADWSSDSGSLSASSIASQGSHALAVIPNGWTEIKSIPLDSLGEVTSTLRYDLRLPSAVGWGETRAILVAPSLGLWTELGSQTLGSLVASEYHTISFAIPESVRAALAGSYSDLRITLVVNAPTLGEPYLLDNLKLTGAGPEGSPLEAFTISTPEGVLPQGTFVSATDHLSVFSQARLGVSGQSPAIANFGRGTSYLQAEAKADASLFSVGNVQLDVKTVVGGSVRTEGSIGKQGVGTADAPVIGGGEFAGVPVPATVRSWSVAWPTSNLGDVQLSAGPQGGNPVVELGPGPYGIFNIHDRNTVALTSGTYFFESFNTEPLAQITLDQSDGPIFIYVRGSLQYKGAFVTVGGEAGQTLVGYLGSAGAFVQAPFSGTLVAPNATIHLERPTSGQHQGAFFAKAVEVAAGQHTVLHLPFKSWDTLFREPPSHQGDNAPAPPLRARWIRPDGTPLRSFGYAPIAPAGLGMMRSAAPPAPAPAPKGRMVAGSSQNPDASPFSRFLPDPPSDADRDASRESDAPVLMALTPPPDAPTETLTIQVQNTTADALGSDVAYSVIVRSWGMGNFAADSTIVAPSASTVLGPGETHDVPFSVMPHLLIHTPAMAAKADFAVGMHHILDGGAVEETPFAFVGVPSFYYNVNEERTAAHIYELERPPAGSAALGETEVDGLVERYRNGVLGDDMFEPDGFFAGIPADDARATHLEAFADRGHAVFGVRPSSHDVDPSTGEAVAPIEAVLPPEGFGGFNNPYDSSTGPTELCWRWPVSYLDKGSEPYPAVIAEAEWNGLVDFIPASYALADLYQADGTPITSGRVRLDENGCLPPQELGTGYFLLRLFTDSFENSGVNFQVRAVSPMEQPDKPPFILGPRRAFSLTASVYIHAPGSRFFIQTGYWTNTTNVAGLASHTMRRHFAGVDMGLKTTRPHLMLVDDIDCLFVDATDPSRCDDTSIFGVSHYSPPTFTVFFNSHTDVWTHDARWKFVLGHELGHQVQGISGVSIGPAEGFGYTFTTGTNNAGGAQDDPQSSFDNSDLIRDCTCDVVDETNASHCLQSIELSEAAQGEGFGHFFATRLWNRVPSEEGYEVGTCNFQYYKQTSSIDIALGGPVVHPISVNCSTAYRHRDQRCAGVDIYDNIGSTEMVSGSELDWLTFWWGVTTHPDAPSTVTVSDVLSWYELALIDLNTAAAGGDRRQVQVEDIIARAPASLQDFLTARASDHGVHDNRF